MADRTYLRTVERGHVGVTFRFNIMRLDLEPNRKTEVFSINTNCINKKKNRFDVHCCKCAAIPPRAVRICFMTFTLASHITPRAFPYEVDGDSRDATLSHNTLCKHSKNTSTIDMPSGFSQLLFNSATEALLMTCHFVSDLKC